MAKRSGKPRAKRAAAEGDSGLQGMSMVELQAELNRRQRATATLLRRREKLMRELEAVNVEIAKAGATAGGAASGRRLRARNPISLVEAIKKVLDGKTMGVNEITDAVQASGYISTSPAFRTIVNQTLINHSSEFKRVSRGQYTNK